MVVLLVCAGLWVHAQYGTVLLDYFSPFVSVVCGTVQYVLGSQSSDNVQYTVVVRALGRTVHMVQNFKQLPHI